VTQETAPRMTGHSARGAALDPPGFPPKHNSALATNRADGKRPELAKHECRRADSSQMDEQEERRPLAGGHLHRRTDAEELIGVVDAETSSRAARRTSPV
jgi:hypothetical protein